MAPPPPPTRSSYLGPLLVLIVGSLYLAKPVLVPLALAVLLTFVLTPVVSAAQRRGLGRVPAVLGTAALTFAVVGGVGWVVGIQLGELVEDLPRQKPRIQQKIADLGVSEGGAFARLLSMIREIGEGAGPAAAKPAYVVVRPEEASGLGRLFNAVGPVLEPLGTAGLIIVLVIFMLIRREDLRNRLIGLVGRGRLTGTTRVLVDAAERVSRLLLTQLLVNVVFGILLGTGLLVLGVPYAFLWGFLAAVLRFVPYIGTWVAAGFPLLISIAHSDGWAQPALVLAFFASLNLVAATVVEPLLFGRGTGVSPMALLAAVPFWTWVWGPIGLLLSTPLTACLVVLGKHVPRFRFFALLLGDTPALEPHVNYYQRLLAHDPNEARQVAQEQARVLGPEEVYDQVLLPALALARRDRRQGGASAEAEAFVFRATREILAALAPPPGPGEVVVLGCPAHHEAEELSLTMLSRLLTADGSRVEVVSTRALPAEIEARVERECPALVFVAVLPPGGLIQARYLCKRLRKRFPGLLIVVGCWGGARRYDKLLVRLRAAGASYVTTSLLQSRTRIRALTPTSPRPSGAR